MSKELSDKLFTLLNESISPDLYTKANMIPIEQSERKAMQDIKNKPSFFPLGHGILFDDKKNENDYNFKNGIMFVGQDWGRKLDLDAALKDSETYSPTWGNIKKIFTEDIPNRYKEIKVPMEKCFFTNIIPGVRNDDKLTGKSRAWENKEFVEAAINFFLVQVKEVEPKAIFIFGVLPLDCLRKKITSLDEKVGSDIKLNSFKTIDKEGLFAFYDVKIGAISTNIFVLTHPSLYYSNLRYRYYDKQHTVSSEKREDIDMIADFLRKSL